MSRSSGPRHVLELPLAVDERSRHVLECRFRAVNTFRNGVLQAALNALDACRVDPAWEAARLLPRRTKEDQLARRLAFETIRKTHGLTEASLLVVERNMRTSCWIGDHVTARLGHVIVKEVLGSIDSHLFLKRGRPRFRKADDCRTINARQRSPMLLKGSLDDGFVLQWSGLILRVRRRCFSSSEIHSLGCEIVHCRAKRVPSGRAAPASPWRYAVQVVVKGKPYLHRERAASGVVGIDTGPAMVGIVWREGPHGAGHALIPLAVEVERDEAAIRKSQRSHDRQRRAANPHCFDDRGR